MAKITLFFMGVELADRGNKPRKLRNLLSYVGPSYILVQSPPDMQPWPGKTLCC